MINTLDLQHSTSYHRVCEQTQKCLNKYELLSNKKVIVGVSGGKDSTLLAYVLKELGYETSSVVVVYNNKNSDELNALRSDLLSIGISLEMIDVKNNPFPLLSSYRDELKELFHLINSNSSVIPCTPCSRIRRICLEEYGSRHRINDVALGHTKEDLITTMLKDYYVYNYYRNFGQYSEKKFSSYVFCHNPDLNIIKDLINQRLVGTMSIKLSNNCKHSVVRPFSFVSEEDIIECNRIADFRTVKTNCIFKRKGFVQTKREIVKEKTVSLCTDYETSNNLLHLALSCLDKSGTSQYSPRSTREEMMPGFEGIK